MKIVLLIIVISLFPLPLQAASMDVLQTVNQALSYNPHLKSSIEARKEAIHKINVAKSGYLPTIGLWTDYGVGFSDNVESRTYNEEYEARGSGNIGLSLSQNIWDGGTTAAAVKGANAALDSANSAFDESTINIAFAALSVHIDVHLQRLLLELAEKNV